VYTGNLCISSNDPVHPLITVPVTLTVRAPTAVVATDLSAHSAPYAPFVMAIPAMVAVIAFVLMRRRKG